MHHTIERELEYFESIEPELTEKYLNKYVVVKDHSVQGVYDSVAEAYAEASETFEEGTFLIRQCLKNREPQVFHSRAYL